MSAARPVFVVGPERSGAHLLAWSLGQHPAFTAGLSTRWLGPFVDDLDRTFAAATVDERAQLSGRGVTPDQFHAAFGEVAIRLLGGPADGPSATRLVDSTPEHAFQVLRLRRLFPDARFIHVVRDVSAVVRLLLDKDVSKLFRSYHREDKAYESWLGAVRAGLEAERALGSGTVLRVLHRDLVTEPERALRRCLSFLGEDWDPACLRLVDGMVADPEPAGGTHVDAGQTAPFREEAEGLSRALLDASTSDPPDAALLDGLERAAAGLRRWTGTPSDVNALAARVVQTMEAVVPDHGRALVVSRGDDRLLGSRAGFAGHFPQGDDGHYLGHHPADSAEAISRLEALRRVGAEFLVIPSTAYWWLDHYADFGRHLDERYPVVARHEDVCVIYQLEPGAAAAARAVERPSLEPVVLRLRQLEAELPALRAQVAMAGAGPADGRGAP